MKKHAKILTAMLLGWVSYTSALYAALDYSGQDVSREWWSSWSGDFKDANFTDATVIYTTFAGTIDLSGSNFTCANCQGASFGSSVTMTGANFTSADLRGSSGVKESDVVLKNTIMSDGSIRNFSMDSDSDKLVIYDTTSVGIDVTLNSIDYSISGGASVVFRLSESYSQDDDVPPGFGTIKGTSGASITFDEGSSVILDFMDAEVEFGEFVLFDTDTITLSGLENVEVSVLSNGAEIISGLSLSENGTIVVSSVPEPSTYAALLGILALSFAIRYKKKQDSLSQLLKLEHMRKMKRTYILLMITALLFSHYSYSRVEYSFEVLNPDEINFTDETWDGVDLTDSTFAVSNAENVVFSSEDKKRDFSKSTFLSATLNGADFSGAILKDVYFSDAELSGAIFTNALIQGVSFYDTPSFTKEQLESTASWKSRDLSGISLSGNNLNSWDFSNQNLQHTLFESSDLSNANFSGADIKFAGLNKVTSKGFSKEQFESTASWKNGDLRGVNLSGNTMNSWDFSEKDLSGASFESSSLENADFTNAIINDVNFSSTNLTKAQLESTDSWKSGNLSALNLSQNVLESWNFSGKDIENISLGSSTIDGSDFSDANVSSGRFGSAKIANTTFANAILKDAYFYLATFKDTSFFGADMRGADMRSTVLNNVDLSYADMRGVEGPNRMGISTTINTIMQDGSISGGALTMDEGDKLYIRPDSKYSVFITEESDVGEGILIFDEIRSDSSNAEIIARGAVLDISDASIVFRFDVSEEVFVGSYLLFSTELDGILEVGTLGKEDFSVLYSDSSEFRGIWDISIDSDRIYLNISSIPEPSSYAVSFGIFAIVIGVYRKIFCFRRFD